MSKNRETQKDLMQKEPAEPGISSSRREFTRASLLASPVLMSVVSRPVFGVGCLSNMLSGNLSDPDRGECNLGLNTLYWQGNPSAWPISPGSLPNGNPPGSCSDCINNGNGTWKCDNGALFNANFTEGPQDALNRSMYEILCTEGTSDQALIITALLNALTDPNYVLKELQVKALWADPTLGGQVTDFQSLLASTWI